MDRIHYACCATVHMPGSKWCQSHHDAYFQVPEAKGARYIRGLRRVIG